MIDVIAWRDYRPAHSAPVRVMELRHLRYFVAVADRLNYRAAAGALHVAQPAISQAIFDLEEELGVMLLARTRREVRLTAAGRMFLGDARLVLDRAALAVSRAQRASRGEIGTLTIGFLGSATVPFLPGLITRYRSRYPDVAIELIEAPADQQLDAIRRGQIQVGFSRPVVKGAGPEIREDILYRDRLMVVLPTSHRLHARRVVRLHDLRHEDWTLFNRQRAPWIFDEAVILCRSAGFTPRIVAQPDRVATALTLIASGMGVSLLPGCVRALADRTLVFRAPTPASSPVPLCILWNGALESSPRDAFRDVVKEHLPTLRLEMKRVIGTR